MTPRDDPNAAPPPESGPPHVVRRRTALRAQGGRNRWLGEPRNAVLIVLASVFLFGGGRKLRQAWLARRAVGRLEDPEVSVEAIAASPQFGRAALIELFRLLSDGRTAEVRDAAGHALSVLWARDELIVEEEKAIARRGFRVDWHARRRYPQSLKIEIPFVVAFKIPCLSESGDGVRPGQLEWAFRASGARRSSLEVFSPWVAGPGRASFALVPSDFDPDSPHRILFVAKARTVGLTETWELELPHVPFVFEIDSRLDAASILTLPDETRGEAVSRSIRLEQTSGDPPESSPSFLPLNADLAIRGAPALVVTTSLPCDLAHSVEIELSDVPGWRPAGFLVVVGQGGEASVDSPSIRRFPIEGVASFSSTALDRPGKRGMRARLVADPGQGWAQPDVRSVWPGTIETNWVDVEIVRR